MTSCRMRGKIEQHLNQIKARKQRMRELSAQAQDMIKINRNYDEADSRLRSVVVAVRSSNFLF